MNREYGVKMISSFDNKKIRIVTHRDVNRNDLDYVLESMNQVIKTYL